MEIVVLFLKFTFTPRSSPRKAFDLLPLGARQLLDRQRLVTVEVRDLRLQLFSLFCPKKDDNLGVLKSTA